MAQFDPILIMPTLVYLSIGLLNIYGISIYINIPNFITGLKFKFKRFFLFSSWFNYPILFSLHLNRYLF